MHALVQVLLYVSVIKQDIRGVHTIIYADIEEHWYYERQ
jgi:hypothetical protein